MAFIFVQHLDPSHESMLVNLLAGHTSMTVRQATDRMPIERDHLYVIPPGYYLSVGAGALHLSQPQVRHGVRLPFDFLLNSLAEEYGARTVCVVLSGTGADGSLGLKAVREGGGLVIVQEPDEAGFDGMPQSAIMTGLVDFVLPVAGIADAIVKHGRRILSGRRQEGPRAKGAKPDRLPEIIELLGGRTAHDFTFYKRGTLQRRIERRMALAAIATDDMDRYLEILRRDTNELELLAKDVLINVTSFFRDPKVFEYLAEKVFPDMVRNHSTDQPLRIWTPGCSTGEEAYSLAMLLHEEIEATKSQVKLRVFASDIDPNAIARAREGIYPETIEQDVSAERLARFFVREERGYRVLPALRTEAVFTVQDIMADPPFSRLDLVSCRNLLIYLRPEAQAKVAAVFHFALRDGGILLLGKAEALTNVDGRFDVISKPERIYRRIGQTRPGAFSHLNFAGGARIANQPMEDRPSDGRTVLADLCQKLVLEAYAPAAVLIDRKYRCLYFMGPTDRYLMVAPGRPIHDLLAMAREGVRTKLRSAIQRAIEKNARIVVGGAHVGHNGNALAFSIAAQPVRSEGEELLLICFIDEVSQKRGRVGQIEPKDLPRVAELEQELEVTRTELEGAIHNLEISSEEQKAINEEALSVNEEFQSTNEELLTSKEELQSLNEELAALNTQLQETLDRQRTTFNDLQNILYSTDIATLFLDTDLNIRFFTPASKLLFHVIPGDIGRPLADLSSLAADTALLADARAVLQTQVPLEQEIEAQSGKWYIRRISPYRTQDNNVEGVVITFSDITERRHAAEALEAAKRQAQLANLAKSRFLAAASHDLRQPLQTLTLVQGLLARAVEGERAKRIAARLDETLSVMSGMLNTLLDINQIEAGTIRVETKTFPVNDLFDTLRNEFAILAQERGLTLRVASSEAFIRSDPRLLAQMIRNLLANALKYTKRGGVLLGCRRRNGMLSIEICDTGVGIPANELDAIFEEYHQLDVPGRGTNRGLGLGLSIVRRLGNLLGHRISVRSRPGNGSIFAIEVALRPVGAELRRRPIPPGGNDTRANEPTRQTGTILLVEDDPEVRELLEIVLRDEGHRTVAVPDGIAALELVAKESIHPDLILADYELPSGVHGVGVSAMLREKLHRSIPVIILTGDISTTTLREIAREDFVQLYKPVKLNELTQMVQRLLLESQSAAPAHRPHSAHANIDQETPVVFIVDDERHVCESMREVFEEDGRIVETYSTGEAFLRAYRPGREACLLLDAYLPGMSGLELLRRLKDAGDPLPVIMITGKSDVSMAVRAMKAGALDFIEKPVGRGELLASVAHALERPQDSRKLAASQAAAANKILRLTSRERQIMELVLAGAANKRIAADLGISQRTVENHRASIMKKTGSKSLAALARMALAAVSKRGDTPPVQADPAPNVRKSKTTVK